MPRAVLAHRRAADAVDLLRRLFCRIRVGSPKRLRRVSRAAYHRQMSVGVARAHRIVGRFCAAMLTAGAMLGVPVGIPSAAAQPCPDIDVTFARGLGDAPGPGPLGDAFINSLRSKVGGRSVGAYGVNYPATSNFLTVSDGVADATNHVNDMIANCPATRLVLGGFSEGAAVVDFLVGAAPSVPAIPGVPGIPGGLPPLPDIPGLPVALPGLDILSGTGPTNPLPRRPSTMWRPLRCSATR